MANKENIRKWVAALRSGDYKQARNLLRGRAHDLSGDIGYCCLGVACEISGLGEFSEFGVYVPYNEPTESSDTVLPAPVAEWLGLDESDPKVGKAKLSIWNDDHRADFNKIADLIEAKYL